MTLVAKGVLQGIWFGFGPDRLLIRVDTEGPAAERLAAVDALRVGFVDPADWEVLIEEPSRARPVARAQREGAGSPPTTVAGLEAACGRILELAVPFAAMDLKPGDPLRFYVEVITADASVDRAPREGILELRVPSPEFERIMWQV